MTVAKAAATKLSSFLVPPARVASILDWKSLGGTVMALDVKADGKIGVAVSSHPSKGEPVYELDPIQIVKGVTSSSSEGTTTASAASRLLEDVVKDERVCAFVVGWPLERGSGRMGGPCGKVLHTLEALTGKNGGADMANHTPNLVGKNRPFALWDDRVSSSSSSSSSAAEESAGKKQINEEGVPDEWGRLAVFGQAPSYSPDMYYSSKKAAAAAAQNEATTSEDSSSSSSSSAARILEHFLKDNWQMEEAYDREASLSLVESSSPVQRRKASPERTCVVTEGTSIDEGGEQVYISQSLL